MPSRAALLLASAMLGAVLLAGCGAPPPAPAPTQKDLSGDARRGRLLYDTACVECHTTQAHWREKRLVKTWPDLIHQVTRWQAIVGQSWRREDVEDVAAYLNEQFYKLP